MMYYHRQVSGLTKEEIGTALSITPEAYSNLKNGSLVLTNEQAVILEELYHLAAGFFIMAANQLAALDKCLEISSAHQNADSDLFRIEKVRQQIDCEVVEIEKAKMEAVGIKMEELKPYFPKDEGLNKLSTIKR